MKLTDLENDLQALRKMSKGQNEKWRREHGSAWRYQLRQVALKHRNIGHEWSFSDEDSKALSDYYTANRTLVACLNAAPGLSAATRRQIEESMLLPESELNKIANPEA